MISFPVMRRVAKWQTTSLYIDVPPYIDGLCFRPNCRRIGFPIDCDALEDASGGAVVCAAWRSIFGTRAHMYQLFFSNLPGADISQPAFDRTFRFQDGDVEISFLLNNFLACLFCQHWSLVVLLSLTAFWNVRCFWFWRHPCTTLLYPNRVQTALAKSEGSRIRIWMALMASCRTVCSFIFTHFPFDEGRFSWANLHNFLVLKTTLKNL